jgi:dTDP-4-amino-4,6-dideoxygalactose transaminase
MIDHLKENDIISVFHYIPLHSSPAGLKYGRVGGVMDVTDSVGKCLLRLPLFCEMREEDVERVVKYLSKNNILNK